MSSKFMPGRDTDIGRERIVAAAAALGDVACWAVGYTPEFCCNVDQFGSAGNAACWDGPYSFATCCVGKLASKEFWRELDSGRQL